MKIQQAEEIIRRTERDIVSFGKLFFPKVFRMPSSPIHQKVSEAFFSPEQYVALICFRGLAKTTLARTAILHRIAFGQSDTVLMVCSNDDRAKDSVKWVREQIEKNTKFTQFFGLRRGKIWSREEIEIVNDNAEKTIIVRGEGLFSGVRGFNPSSYRPDLICLDDVITDANSKTVNARAATAEQIEGAVMLSLIPKTDNPASKLVLLNTPIHSDDYAMQTIYMESWSTYHYSCWTPESQDKPLHEKESCWPEMFPAKILVSMMMDKKRYGRGHIWTREMECQITSQADAEFRKEDLVFWDPPQVKRDQFFNNCILAVDPTPPVSDDDAKRGLSKRDWFAIVCMGLWNGKLYLLDMRAERGTSIEWIKGNTRELVNTWKPLEIVVEANNFQTMLMPIFERVRQECKVYTAITKVDHMVKKQYRISAHVGWATDLQKLYVPRENAHIAEWLAEFEGFPGYKDDDLLDATAMAVARIREIYPDLDTRKQERKIADYVYPPLLGDDEIEIQAEETMGGRSKEFRENLNKSMLEF